MRIDVITLFPEMFEALSASIPGRAMTAGALELHTHQLRNHAINKHNQVDDAPYGGEAGMVLRPEPLRDALQALLANVSEPDTLPGAARSGRCTCNSITWKISGMTRWRHRWMKPSSSAIGLTSLAATLA